MARVIYSCPYVPAELIAAQGLTPERLIPCAPNGRSAAPPEGICPYAWAFSCAAGEARCAAVFTTVCDQMRRAFEFVAGTAGRKAFLMNVPSTWDTAVARRIYLNEFKRLASFLERCGGRPLTLDHLRALLRGRARQESSAVPSPAGSLARKGPRVPIALVGGPLPAGNGDFRNVLEDLGGTIALDASETGERTIPGEFDRKLSESDPLAALAEAYLSIPDAFRRPNRALYEYLSREIRARGIRGVILRYYTWCDTWRAEDGRLKEVLAVPVTAVVADGTAGVDAHAVSRIAAFLEVIR